MCLFLIRELIMTGVRIAGISHWSWKLISDLSLIALAVLWLVFLVFCQVRYHRAVGGGIWRSLLFITGVQLFVLPATQIAIEIVGGSAPGGITLIFLACQAAAGTALIVISRRITGDA